MAVTTNIKDLVSRGLRVASLEQSTGRRQRAEAAARLAAVRLNGQRSKVRFPQCFATKRIAAAFVSSRAVVLGIIALSAVAVPISPQNGISGFQFRRPDIAQVIIVGDAAEYVHIATGGYDHVWARAYFPLYPLLLRIAPERLRIAWGLLLSNCAFFLALYLFFKLVMAYGMDPETATTSCLYWAIFPGSHFFSIVMTESLFVCLAVASLLAAKRRKWWLASGCAALATATRLPGIALFPALVAEFWISNRTLRHKHALTLLVAPSGMVAFMAFLWQKTGDPLAFIHAQARFGHSMAIPIWGYLRRPGIFHLWGFYPLHFLCTAIWIAAIVSLVRRHQWTLAAFTAVSLAAVLFGFPITPNRYLLAAFPVFIVLAGWFKSATYVVLSASGMAVLTVLFAFHYGLAAT